MIMSDMTIFLCHWFGRESANFENPPNFLLGSSCVIVGVTQYFINRIFLRYEMDNFNIYDKIMYSIFALCVIVGCVSSISYKIFYVDICRAVRDRLTSKFNRFCQVRHLLWSFRDMELRSHWSFHVMELRSC